MKSETERAALAVADYLRHLASGYALLRSVKANGARDALYQVAEQIEKNWPTIIGPRLAADIIRGTETMSDVPMFPGECKHQTDQARCWRCLLARVAELEDALIRNDERHAGATASVRKRAERAEERAVVAEQRVAELEATVRRALQFTEPGRVTDWSMNRVREILKEALCSDSVSALPKPHITREMMEEMTRDETYSSEAQIVERVYADGEVRKEALRPDSVGGDKPLRAFVTADTSSEEQSK